MFLSEMNQNIYSSPPSEDSDSFRSCSSYESPGYSTRTSDEFIYSNQDTIPKTNQIHSSFKVSKNKSYAANHKLKTNKNKNEVQIYTISLSASEPYSYHPDEIAELRLQELEDMKSNSLTYKCQLCGMGSFILSVVFAGITVMTFLYMKKYSEE